MRGIRAWLAAPDRLTDREANALVATCYLVGYLTAMALDYWHDRRRAQLEADARIEAALRSVFAQVEELQKGGKE